jgi:hypothetical protein
LNQYWAGIQNGLQNDNACNGLFKHRHLIQNPEYVLLSVCRAWNNVLNLSGKMSHQNKMLSETFKFGRTFFRFHFDFMPLLGDLRQYINNILMSLRGACMQFMVNTVFQEGWLLFYVRTKSPTDLAFGRKNCEIFGKCLTVISGSGLSIHFVLYITRYVSRGVFFITGGVLSFVKCENL